MHPKIKLAVIIVAVVWLIVLTSFITKKSEVWFKPATEIKVVFDDCVFSAVPLLRPIKDKTYYYFKGCKMNGQNFAETITPSEVDEAIAKLDKMEVKK
jgi:hypothetical protein